MAHGRGIWERDRGSAMGKRLRKHGYGEGTLGALGQKGIGTSRAIEALPDGLTGGGGAL